MSLGNAATRFLKRQFCLNYMEIRDQFVDEGHEAKMLSFMVDWSLKICLEPAHGSRAIKSAAGSHGEQRGRNSFSSIAEFVVQQRISLSPPKATL